MVLPAAGVKDSIIILTTKSQSCQGPANQITVVNVALAVSGFGPIPVVIQRLTDIVTTCGTTIQQFAGTKPYTEKGDQDIIFEAFRDFVKVHQDLLNILIGKGGLVPALLPFVGPPLAAVLRQIESVVDTIAFELIDACEARSTDLTAQKDALDVVIGKTIDTWSGSVTVTV
ncbi:MAG: hypothetical protein GOMPHAMPRED_003114 [Gomphillus americanus]|uniref:Uncharacterized protein n=1 Tax=Gomphillus americanus TaxID=1940652 RepID=A0A8H3I9I4_9LECA|nr:MAG: hypothetical protein GOMPHAMPRED_003114 [Gomphillus americanus]